MDGWSAFLAGPRLGDPDGILVGNFERPPAGMNRRNFGWKFQNGPRLGNQKGSWLENVKVKCWMKWMEMWSGGPKEGVSWSNGRVQAW